MSAPAATTAVTSSPRRAKLAERMLGAMRYVRIVVELIGTCAILLGKPRPLPVPPVPACSLHRAGILGVYLRRVLPLHPLAARYLSAPAISCAIGRWQAK